MTVSLRGALASLAGIGSRSPGSAASLPVDLSSYDLGDAALYAVAELVAWPAGLADDDRRALALLLLAAQLSVHRGSTRLPLDRAVLRELVMPVAGGASGDIGRVLDRALAIAGGAVDTPLLGGPADYRPLVVAGGFLYQQRMWACEARLRAQLDARLAAPRLALADADVDAALQAVRGDSRVRLSSEQQHAVREAVLRPFTVITGGPGTGKTAIIVSILRALVRLGTPVSDYALAAPTGKAAQRMRASIAGSLANIAQPELFDSELLAHCPAPQTLHRLLGYSPGQDRFRHHEHNRLTQSVVLVDEGSMIDIFLMERLLRALRADARLILLGDADQLPSVDAGAVLRDLVPHAVRLTRSYRMNPRDPEGRRILTLARNIKAGRTTGLDIEPVQERIGGFLDRWYRQHIAGAAEFARLAGKVYRWRHGGFDRDDQRDLAALFAIYDRARLLTVTRGFATGATAINQHMHGAVLADATVDQRPDFYPGEPIAMRENDYDRRIFNGDQGLIVRVADGDSPGHQFRAVFAASGASPGRDTDPDVRVFHLDALRAQIELAFAMTVHKSQGSEFDHVAVILPDTDLPLLTRELLYTAVTRSRRSLVILGSPAIVRRAIARCTQRYSGLAAAAPESTPRQPGT
jgi:exodeoxyribonuclease V alpha subunit